MHFNRTMSGSASRSPQATASVAMALLVAGLMFLVLGINWGRLPVAGYFHQAGSDVARGILFGLAIGVEIYSVVVALFAATRAK